MLIISTKMTDMTYDDIKRWVLENTEDEAAMDDLNKLTYMFTSKYRSQLQK